MKKRTYIVELDSAPIAEAVDGDLLERFTVALDRERQLTAPATEVNMLVKAIGFTAAVAATGPQDALAVAVSAFERATIRAGVADVVIADASIEIESGDENLRSELISGAEVARRLGISRERVSQLVEIPGRFPAALTRVGQYQIWRWGDILDWQAVGGRRPTGRPPTTFAAIALGLLARSSPNWQELRRRMIDRANSLEPEAVEYVNANQDTLGVFHDGYNWVDHVDSGRGPGIAVGSPRGTSITKTR